jgi:hypothetical protein
VIIASKREGLFILESESRYIREYISIIRKRKRLTGLTPGPSPEGEGRGAA